MTKNISFTKRLAAKATSFLVKSFGLSQLSQMWLAGQDVPDRSASKPSRPYRQVDLVFACVNKLIDGIIGLPPVLSTIDEDIIESGPVYDCLFKNPALGWEKFVVDTIGHYALSRDVFWVFTEMQGMIPKEIMVVSGTQMHPVTDNNRADGNLVVWEFRGTGGQRVRFAPFEVHQWKNFNPYDKFHGIGPATASKLNIDYSYAASLFNATTLDNAAEPGAILTTQGRLEPDQVELLRSQFDARHKGAGKTKRTAILTGGMDIKTIAMKMADLEISKISERTDKKICSTFGVPPGVVGLITQAQYSHGPAQEDFIFNTIIPLASMFAGHILTGIISRFYTKDLLSAAIKLGDSKYYRANRISSLYRKSFYRQLCQKAVNINKQVFIWFDTDQHPTVQRAKQEQAGKVLKFTEAGVPLNQIIEAHDLPYERVDWGDDWWIGMGQVPARYTLEAGFEGLTGPSLPEGEPPGGEEPGKSVVSVPSVVNEKADEQQRLRIWRNWVTSWAGIEKEYQGALRTLFVRQQRILLEKLKKVLAEYKAVSDEIKAMSDEIIARVVFDLNIENNKLKVINHTFFEKGSELGIRQSLSEALGVKGDKLDELVKRAKLKPQVKRSLLISSHKIVKVNQTTQNLVANQLRKGLDAGEGLNELSKRISNTLGSNRARALSIARTQTAGAVETGRFAGMQEAGIEKKTWLTSRDNEVRDSHLTAESRYADGIALDVPFQVGSDFLMYPGDPNDSAGNIINCRCLMLAKAGAGRSFDLAYYSNLQFYSYNDMQKAKDKSATENTEKNE